MLKIQNESQPTLSKSMRPTQTPPSKKLIFFSSLFSKINADFLLLNRIIYKTSNIFRRQRHFQQIKLAKKLIKKLLFDFRGKKDDKSFILELVSDENFEGDVRKIMELLVVVGGKTQEMMKIKLYLNYCVVIYGIVSRLYAIFEYLVDNNT